VFCRRRQRLGSLVLSRVAALVLSVVTMATMFNKERQINPLQKLATFLI